YKMRACCQSRKQGGTASRPRPFQYWRDGVFCFTGKLCSLCTKRCKGDNMKEQLEKIKLEALDRMEAADSLDTLNEIRVAYLGKKGELTSVLKSMKDVAPEDRPKVGQMVNEVRELLETKLEETK